MGVQDWKGAPPRGAAPTRSPGPSGQDNGEVDEATDEDEVSDGDVAESAAGEVAAVLGHTNSQDIRYSTRRSGSFPTHLQSGDRGQHRRVTFGEQEIATFSIASIDRKASIAATPDDPPSAPLEADGAEAAAAPSDRRGSGTRWGSRGPPASPDEAADGGRQSSGAGGPPPGSETALALPAQLPAPVARQPPRAPVVSAPAPRGVAPPRPSRMSASKRAGSADATGLQLLRSKSGAFQGLVVRKSKGAMTSVVKLMIISDLGQDNDDEMALMLVSELVRSGEVELKAVVANLRPAPSRAALARGTLDMLGLEKVPVGIGTDGGSTTHSDTFRDYISVGKTGVNYLEAHLQSVNRVLAAAGTPDEATISQECRIFEGQKLMKQVLEAAEAKSITLLLLSSMKDAAQFLRAEEELFAAKVNCVTIMGGVSSEVDEDGIHLPDEQAHNNCFDLEASRFVYRRIQELGVQMVVLSRYAAYACPVGRHVYDLMVRMPVPNPVACRLHRAQRTSIDRLWVDVCSGGRLPARCDRTWFCNTFCGGEGVERKSSDSMWDKVKHFNMYDPLALLAALQSKRDLYFAAEEEFGENGEVIIVGIDAENHGLKPTAVRDLQDYLMAMWIRAAGRPREGQAMFSAEDHRPKELDSEELTAALKPIPAHSHEELDKIRGEVLELLDKEWPNLKNSSSLTTWRERDKHISKVGPPMKLLHWETVIQLGRIPHSEEDRAITMEQANKIAERNHKRFFIEMFSHRWYSRYAPDDLNNSKAAALVEWARYRAASGLETFYWIDYSCIDQNDIAPGLCMLPLYVSSCNNIICYDTPEYECRAWCRVERLLFAAFVAPNNEYISPDFTFDGSIPLENREVKPHQEEQALVPDPEAGDLSYMEDASLIRDLMELCKDHWGACWKDGLLNSVKEKLQHVESLEFGMTQVRLRRFGPPRRRSTAGASKTPKRPSSTAGERRGQSGGGAAGKSRRSTKERSSSAAPVVAARAAPPVAPAPPLQQPAQPRGSAVAGTPRELSRALTLPAPEPVKESFRDQRRDNSQPAPRDVAAAVVYAGPPRERRPPLDKLRQYVESALRNNNVDQLRQVYRWLCTEGCGIENRLVHQVAHKISAMMSAKFRIAIGQGDIPALQLLVLEADDDPLMAVLLAPGLLELAIAMVSRVLGNDWRPRVTRLSTAAAPVRHRRAVNGPGTESRSATPTQSPSSSPRGTTKGLARGPSLASLSPRSTLRQTVTPRRTVNGREAPARRGSASPPEPAPPPPLVQLGSSPAPEAPPADLRSAAPEEDARTAHPWPGDLGKAVSPGGADPYGRSPRQPETEPPASTREEPQTPLPPPSVQPSPGPAQRSREDSGARRSVVPEAAPRAGPPGSRSSGGSSALDLRAYGGNGGRVPDEHLLEAVANFQRAREDLELQHRELEARLHIGAKELYQEQGQVSETDADVQTLLNERLGSSAASREAIREALGLPPQPSREKDWSPRRSVRTQTPPLQLQPPAPTALGAGGPDTARDSLPSRSREAAVVAHDSISTARDSTPSRRPSPPVVEYDSPSTARDSNSSRKAAPLGLYDGPCSPWDAGTSRRPSPLPPRYGDLPAAVDSAPSRRAASPPGYGYESPLAAKAQEFSPGRGRAPQPYDGFGLPSARERMWLQEATPRPRAVLPIMAHGSPDTARERKAVDRWVRGAVEELTSGPYAPSPRIAYAMEGVEDPDPEPASCEVLSSVWANHDYLVSEERLAAERWIREGLSDMERIVPGIAAQPAAVQPLGAGYQPLSPLSSSRSYWTTGLPATSRGTALPGWGVPTPTGAVSQEKLAAERWAAQALLF